jgi:hypothetical protein
MWTFAVPKLLRPFFLHHRELLGQLCRAAWETVAELVAEAAGNAVRPGMVTALHTASSDLRWHPHVHVLASRGGWDRDGTWRPCTVRGREGGRAAVPPEGAATFLTDPPVVDRILMHLEQKSSPESERRPPGTPIHLAS